MTVSTKNFHPDTDRRLRCSCGCNGYEVQQWALDKLQEVREAAGRPLTVTSGYRCKDHPSEARKASPGHHNFGTAFDIAVNGGAERHELIKLGIEHGATGIGVAKTFVHLDWRGGQAMAWEY